MLLKKLLINVIGKIQVRDNQVSKKINNVMLPTYFSKATSKFVRRGLSKYLYKVTKVISRNLKTCSIGLLIDNFIMKQTYDTYTSRHGIEFVDS